MHIVLKLTVKLVCISWSSRHSNQRACCGQADGETSVHVVVKLTVKPTLSSDKGVKPSAVQINETFECKLFYTTLVTLLKPPTAFRTFFTPSQQLRSSAHTPGVQNTILPNEVQWSALFLLLVFNYLEPTPFLSDMVPL